MPTDLKELASAMATYERLVSEIPTIEKTFPPITEKMTTLGWEKSFLKEICLILNNGAHLVLF